MNIRVHLSVIIFNVISHTVPKNLWEIVDLGAVTEFDEVKNY